jgi:hypothetical protein
MKTFARPKCLNYGCNKPVANSGARYRPFCDTCHKAGYKGLPLAVGVTAFKQGVCSNVDEHLGFPCYIDWKRVKRDKFKVKTHIDHKDGNYLNNTTKNCEELCETCHSEKSKRAGDFKNQYRYF